MCEKDLTYNISLKAHHSLKSEYYEEKPQLAVVGNICRMFCFCSSSIQSREKPALNLSFFAEGTNAYQNSTVPLQKQSLTIFECCSSLILLKYKYIAISNSAK